MSERTTPAEYVTIAVLVAAGLVVCCFAVGVLIDQQQKARKARASSNGSGTPANTVVVHESN